MSQVSSVPTQPEPTSGDNDPEYIQWKKSREPKTTETQSDEAAPRTVNADEVDRIVSERLAERDKQHASDLARLQAQVPQLLVPANSGGPGSDNHRRSWNLAEQEAAARGEDMPHWHDD